MSLAIDADTVTRVLLADGWHDVADKSFTLDSYEFMWNTTDPWTKSEHSTTLHGGGNSGICATGFTFRRAAGDNVSGPLTSVLAVTHRT